MRRPDSDTVGAEPVEARFSIRETPFDKLRANGFSR